MKTPPCTSCAPFSDWVATSGQERVEWGFPTHLPWWEYRHWRYQWDLKEIALKNKQKADSEVQKIREELHKNAREPAMNSIASTRYPGVSVDKEDKPPAPDLGMRVRK